jgi:hypothetical protein
VDEKELTENVDIAEVQGVIRVDSSNVNERASIENITAQMGA